MKGFRVLSLVLALVVLAVGTGYAQNNIVNAADFNWSGVQVTSGNTATGAGVTISVDRTTVTTVGGYQVNPFSTSASITVSGATANTFTPTTLTNCGDFSQSCVITGTIANTHVKGDTVRSGTYGMQSAIDYLKARGGGIIVVDRRFQGATANITGAVGDSTVTIMDVRTGGPVYYGWNGVSAYAAILNIGATSIVLGGNASLGATSITTAQIGQINQYGNAVSGGSCQSYSTTETMTIAAAATSTSASATLLPANSTINAVCYRVTTLIPTAATFSIGDGTTAGRFGTGIAVAAGTNGCANLQWNPANTNAAGPVQGSDAAVVITPNAQPADATGRVKLVIYYTKCTAPTA